MHVINKYKIPFALSFVFLILFTACGFALQSDGLEHEVVECQLDNGLTLLVAQRPDIPTFTAFITLGVGSANEQENNRGIAHLLEHMRFKGTQTIGTKDYAEEKNCCVVLMSV